MDDAGMRNLPNANNPREHTVPNRLEVKWCGLCGSWTDHYRDGHTGGEEKTDVEGDEAGLVTIDTVADNEDDPPPPSGAFTQLHTAGLV